MAWVVHARDVHDTELSHGTRTFETMTTHADAGRPVPDHRRSDIPELLTRFAAERPDAAVPGQRVSFGTSGHRGSPLHRTFNADHILAIVQAVAEHRTARGRTGPMVVGRDTHAVSEPALEITLDVLAANGVRVLLDQGSAFTPTPVMSHAILTADERADGVDGLILTPSHNPPEDGGIKYNPPHGGPADTDETAAIEARANEILAGGLADVRRAEAGEGRSGARRAALRTAYIRDLASVLDLDAIAGAGVRIGVDPMGGASVEYWDEIADTYGLELDVVNPAVDPAFAFMRLDWDGKVRMDCSSPYAMAGLIELRDRYDVAVGLDPDADRHGVVTPSAGLLNPNHYLAVAVWYLFQNRPGWNPSAGVGKTLVSSSMIDRVAGDLGRPVVEVPVGFKWFVPGLMDGTLAFGGEESAGASFVRKDGTVWTTDKDGILLCLLAAEITARTGRDPGELYQELENRFGAPVYERVDAAASPEQKAALKLLAPEDIAADTLAGGPILAKLARAPGNGAAIGGVKVVARDGWFAARPSGTEDVYKIYAESFRGEAHLARIQDEARQIVDDAFRARGVVSK
jgi:phosphoglucomutase